MTCLLVLAAQLYTIYNRLLGRLDFGKQHQFLLDATNFLQFRVDRS